MPIIYLVIPQHTHNSFFFLENALWLQNKEHKLYILQDIKKNKLREKFIKKNRIVKENQKEKDNKMYKYL